MPGWTLAVCADTRPLPSQPLWAGAAGLFPRFTIRPHASVTGARISPEPRRAFLWSLWTLQPSLFPALLRLSCQISLPSLPQPFGSIQVVLVPWLLLGKETTIQPVSSSGFSALLPIYLLSRALSSHVPVSLLWPRAALGAVSSSIPRASLAFLPPPSSNLFFFLSALQSLEQSVLSTISSFFLLFQYSIVTVNSVFLYSAGIVYQMKHQLSVVNISKSGLELLCVFQFKNCLGNLECKIHSKVF